MKPDEYYRIAAACDGVLRRPEATVDWVAIPWLHVVCQHPVIVERYEGLIDEAEAAERGGLGRTVRGRVRHTARVVHRHAMLGRELFRAVAGAARWRKAPLPIASAPRADIVIVSWLVNVDQLETPGDFYLGDLQRQLADRGVSSLLLLRNLTDRPTPDLDERARREAPCGRLVLPDLLPPAQELALARRCLRARSELRRVASGAEASLDGAVARAAALHALSIATVANLRMHAQVEALCRQVRPRAVMTLFEGQGWERCVWHAARAAGTPVLCVGYQHTVLWEHAHAIRRSLGRTGEYDPDVILTVGEVTRQALADHHQFEDARLLAFGTHRRTDDVASAPSGAGPVFLVVPEGHVSECLHLFAFALECARRLPEARFILRTHAVLPFERIESKLRAHGFPLPNVEVSRGRSIEDDFARARYLLYRGSSTAVYAILAGLKPFYLSRPGEMDIDPLHELSGWRERVSSVEDVVGGCAVHQAQGERAEEEWRRAVTFCGLYMHPIREEAIREMVDWMEEVSAARPAVGTRQ